MAGKCVAGPGGDFRVHRAAALLEAYAARTSSGTFINIHHFHGAATRAAPESGAFGLRQDHYMVELIETGAPDGGPLSGEWPRRASAILAPHALPGGYPNLLGPDDEQQAAAAYGPHTARLLEVKARLDPDSVFTATPRPGRTNAPAAAAT